MSSNAKIRNVQNRGRPFRSAELQSIVLPHMTYGIDVIARAGELRFYDLMTDEFYNK